MYGNSSRELGGGTSHPAGLHSFRCGGPKARAIPRETPDQILRTVDERQACLGGEESSGHPLATNGEATGVLNAAVSTAKKGAESSPSDAENLDIGD